MAHEGMGMDQDMMAMMGGMPDWIVLLTILAMMGISLFLVLWLNLRPQPPDSRPYWTADLLKLPLINRLVKSRFFQFSLQLPLVLLFLFVIATGLFGNQLTSKNIAPLITWTVWWAGLTLIILMMGKSWCLICPWNALAQWIERLSLWQKRTTCPHDNVAVNVRSFGADLADQTKGHADEAYLVIVMLCMTIFHGLTMTQVWSTIHTGISQTLNMGYLGAFSIGMAGTLLVPVVLYAGTIWVARLNIRQTGLTMKQGFVVFAYPFLPIALFYHMAHNTEHFFMEGQKIIALASDPFGWGWNLFGTAGLYLEPFMHLSTIWWIQAGLMVVGQIAGVAILVRIARRILPTWQQALRTQIPILLLMLACSLLNVWLTSQPMMMRTGM